MNEIDDTIWQEPWRRADQRKKLIEPLTNALNRIGYPNISAILAKAIEIHSQESPLTSSLGFCAFNIPERGPENDRHWNRLIQKFRIQHGLGWGTAMKSIVDLDEDTLEVMMDSVKSLGVKVLPSSNRQKELLANIIDGAFGQEIKDSMIARILQWNSPRSFFVQAEDLIRSFDLLKDTVDNLPSNRVWFTEQGITIIGTSGQLYELRPSPRRPYYMISIPKHDSGVCINIVDGEDKPFGDHLTALVLGLFNDEATAETIPLLKQTFSWANPKSDSAVETCENCDRVLTQNANTSNPALAPQSNVNPMRCRTCHAGNSLPQAARELGYKQANRSTEESSEGVGGEEE